MLLEQRSKFRPATLSSLLVTSVVVLCCGLPVAWVLWQIGSHPASLLELRGDKWRWQLVARTVGYNAIAALIAMVLAAPVALVLGRGKGWIARLLWILLPASLLIPSIVYAYAWSQFVWLVSGHLQLMTHSSMVHQFGKTTAWIMGPRAEPGSVKDIGRCVWSLGAWLWPIPAGLIGLSLRRLDSNLQQQAVLDGALMRTTLWQIAPAIAASFAIALVLAMQEFAVYEPTGISVIAVEVRTVFDTGGLLAVQGVNAWKAGGIESAGFAQPDQASRAAAAVVTGAPLVLMVAFLSALALWGLFKISGDNEVDDGPIPGILQSTWRTKIPALGTLVIVIVLPVLALLLSHSSSRPLGFMIKEFHPQVMGTQLIAVISMALGGVLAFLACVRIPKVILYLSIAGFLIGGQFIAIALIHVYNHKWLEWVYDGLPVMIIAYMARFAWISLLAARGTASPAYRPVRDMAAVDGATRWQTTVWVLWPLAWPTLVAAAVLVGVLSMGEVPATVLLSPLRPPMLVPSLMTWVHTLRFDPMIEASLLLAGLSVVLAVVVSVLVALGLRLKSQQVQRTNAPPIRRGKRGKGMTRLSLLLPLFSLLVLSQVGCGRGKMPDAIYLDTGVGPAQVVYPRAITYSPKDDTFFVVDRRARVQHIDTNGHFLNDWMMPSWRYGKPTGLSVGPDGNVYVPDTHYHRVIVYTPMGKEIRRWGDEGTADGQFIWPTDVAFDNKGHLFVTEYGDNDRIQVFDMEGKFLYKFGSFGTGPGQFSRPQSMVIDGDILYVTDACNHRIDVFKTDGTFIRSMGKVGSGLGEFRFPYGLDMDRKGHLVVTEFGNNRIQWVEKETGRGLGTWGVAGRQPGELAYPWASVVDKHGRILIVDAGNNRLQVLNQ